MTAMVISPVDKKNLQNTLYLWNFFILRTVLWTVATAG